MDRGFSLIPLRTERLWLRPFEPSDLPAIRAMDGDAQTMKYLGGPRSAEQSRDELQQLLAGYELYGFGPFALVLPESGLVPQPGSERGRVIGRCGLALQQIDGRRQFDLAYLVAREHWHRGYASEAAAAVRDWAFGAGLSRLICLIDPANTASVRVAQKLGFSFEKKVQHDGRTVALYALGAPTPLAKRY